MDWTLDKSRPMCPQICEIICLAIANGEFSAGDKLLSVRELALKTGVNPNTIQKSFEELERRGVVHSVRCSGWFVNESIDAAKAEVDSLRNKKTEEYLAEMEQLGCTGEEIIEYIMKAKEVKNERDS